MGVYLRPDSPFWWVLLDGYDLRESTKIPRTGVSPERVKMFRKQAEQVYAKRMSELALTERLPVLPVVSFAAHRAWYESHHAAHLRGVGRVLSMLRQLDEYFGHTASLTDITPDAIREWMTWRKRQVAPATVNRELDVLKSLLRTAVPRYLPASPAASMRRFRVAEAEPRVLTPDEEVRLMEVGSDSDRAWIVLALDTLLRLSNTVDLKWAQVKTDVIIPLNAKVSHDTAPITTRLSVALDALPRESVYVFPQFHEAKKGGAQASKQLAIRRFAYLCKLAKVEHGRDAEGVTFHCLRHTGATRALQRGASVRTVMKLGGWKDERMVMRYSHATDQDVRDAAESIGSESREPHVSDDNPTPGARSPNGQ